MHALISVLNRLTGGFPNFTQLDDLQLIHPCLCMLRMGKYLPTQDLLPVYKYLQC